MFKALTPVIGIIVAVGLFFTYIQPTFKDIKSIQDETAAYAQAVEKASELQKRIDELTQQQTSISLANLEQLDALLPDRVDEVAVLLDLDTLATLHHLTLGDIEVGNQEKNETGKQDTQKESVTVGPTADPLNGAVLGVPLDETIHSQYATLGISFSVSGTYNDFRLFLQDIEHSLVLMEVTKITFARSEGEATAFMVTVQLYSLNPSTP